MIVNLKMSLPNLKNSERNEKIRNLFINIKPDATRKIEQFRSNYIKGILDYILQQNLLKNIHLYDSWVVEVISMSKLKISSAKRKLFEINILDIGNDFHKIIKINSLDEKIHFNFQKDLKNEIVYFDDIEPFFNLVLENVNDFYLGTNLEQDIIEKNKDKIINIIRAICYEKLIKNVSRNQIEEIFDFKPFIENKGDYSILNFKQLDKDICSFGGSKYYIGKELSKVTNLSYFYIKVKIKKYRVKYIFGLKFHNLLDFYIKNLEKFIENISELKLALGIFDKKHSYEHLNFGIIKDLFQDMKFDCSDFDEKKSCVRNDILVEFDEEKKNGDYQLKLYLNKNLYTYKKDEINLHVFENDIEKYLDNKIDYNIIRNIFEKMGFYMEIDKNNEVLVHKGKLKLKVFEEYNIKDRDIVVNVKFPDSKIFEFKKEELFLTNFKDHIEGYINENPGKFDTNLQEKSSEKLNLLNENTENILENTNTNDDKKVL